MSIVIHDGTMVGWRELMKYTSLIPKDNGPWEDMMDAMEGLIPVFFYRTKLDSLLHWMKKCKDSGLITYGEKHDLQHYLIHSYSGM